MFINLEEIKELLASEITGYRISRETDVKQQNYDNYKLGKSDFDNMPVKTLVELQNFINKRKEERKMKKYAVVVNLEDKNGRVIDVNFDTLVSVEKTIENVEKFIDDDKGSSSYEKAEKIIYAVYEVNDEILEDENDEFGDILEMGTDITYEVTKDIDGEFKVINGINPENEYTVKNLMFTTYYKGDNSIDLEFDINNRPVIVRVEAPEGSFTDEDYFDSQENLDKALENRL